MKPRLTLITTLYRTSRAGFARDTNGLAPEVVDPGPKNIAWAAEKLVPDPEKPSLSTTPADLKDGVTVGKLANSEAVLKFADEFARVELEDVDNRLIAHRGQLLF